MKKAIRFLCALTAIGMLFALAGCQQAHTHTYEEKTLAVANCLKDGQVEYRCTDCDHSYVETVKGDHVYFDEVLEESTCEVKGRAEYTCIHCSDSYEDELPLKSHEYNENKYCINCGTKKVGKIQLPFTPASFNYGSGDWVRSTCRITDVSYEINYYGQMTIYFDGVMTCYDSGNTVSGPCSFMLIVYDAYGNIVYSDQIMTHCIVNQTFKIYTTVDAYIDSTENYRIVLDDYMM